MKIRNTLTNEKRDVRRDVWEAQKGTYSANREIWEILDDGHPVVLLEFRNNKWVQTKLVDLDKADSLSKSDPKKFSYIPFDEKSEIKPIRPIKSDNDDLSDELKEGIEPLVEGETAKKIIDGGEIVLESQIEVLEHRTSVKKNDQILNALGFFSQGLIGYVSTQKSEEQIELYRVNFEDTYEQLLITQESNEKFDGRKFKVEPTFGNASRRKTELKLHRFHKRGSEKIQSDHFSCTNPNYDLLKKYQYEEETDEVYGDVYLFDSPGAGRLPLYVYSNLNEDVQLFEPLPEPTAKTDKTAFLWSDTPTEEDQLGRKQLTDEVVGLVEELFKGDGYKGAYTILLNGEWGAGKSSMLNFLEAKLHNDHGWKITKYNAWENQQFKDPWWILINAISKQASDEGFSGDFASHRAWKFGIQYRNKVWALLLIAIFVGSSIFLFNSSIPNGQLSIPVISGLVGLIGSVTSAIVGLTNNFFFRNISNQDLKERFADHPFKKIRQRFKDISKDNKLAIFIDDLDRCEPEPTVKLLEGIQTLFKDSKVLYVIAADANWLIRCFDKHYEDFSVIARPGHTIGEKFLEKSFQLKVTVPEPNQQVYDSFYDQLIDLKTVEQEENNTPSNNEEEETEQENTQITTDTPDPVESQEEESTEPTEREKVEENLPKYLDEFRKAGVPKNPRQMKRFINQYIILRATLKAEGTEDFDSFPEDFQNKAVRYQLFTMQFPKLANLVKNDKLKLSDLADLNEDLKHITDQETKDCLSSLTEQDKKRLKEIFEVDEKAVQYSDDDLSKLKSV